MDLLIHLIKKNEVDIYDIPIALITDQYLEYIEWMKSMNIDFAGDFLFMAACLVQIKSRMLLPAHETEGDEEDEDPRSQLTRPLIEYMQLKSAAEQLATRNLLGDNIFTRKPAKEIYLSEADTEMIKVGLFDLIDAFQNILKNAAPDHHVDLTTDRISVKERMSELVEILEEKGSITFNELFPAKVAKSEIIVTFLAVLEMVKLCLIQVAQHVQTGIIRLFYL